LAAVTAPHEEKDRCVPTPADAGRVHDSPPQVPEAAASPGHARHHDAGKRRPQPAENNERDARERADVLPQDTSATLHMSQLQPWEMAKQPSNARVLIGSAAGR
jgi:hypothetical protein